MTSNISLCQVARFVCNDPEFNASDSCISEIEATLCKHHKVSY